MTKKHGPKKRARQNKRKSGAGYASAAAGTAHRHAGPDIPPVEGTALGRYKPIDMTVMSRLVGAVMDACVSCQKKLVHQAAGGDHLAVTSLTGLVMNLLPASPGPGSCAQTCAFYPIARDQSDDGIRAASAYIAKLTKAERMAVLWDCLDFLPILLPALKGLKTGDKPEPIDPDSVFTPPTGKEGEFFDLLRGEFGDSVDPFDLLAAARLAFNTSDPEVLSSMSGILRDARDDAPPGSEGASPADGVIDEEVERILRSLPVKVTLGMDLFLSPGEVSEVMDQLKLNVIAGRRVSCWLCDEEIVPVPGAIIHLGLAVSHGSTEEGDGDEHGDQEDEVYQVWTHPACGPARIWTLLQINTTRIQAGLPAWIDDPTETEQPGPPGNNKVITSFVRSEGGMLPLLVLQPGLAHQFGTSGHITDLLSFGLRPVDIGEGLVDDLPDDLPDWEVRVQRGKLAEIGSWNTEVGVWCTADAAARDLPGDWKKVAAAARQVVVVVLPPHWITSERFDLDQVLSESGRQQCSYGGIMELHGTLS